MPVGPPIGGQRRARSSKPCNVNRPAPCPPLIEDAMTKRLQAKYKLDRRMGQNIWGRPKSPVNRREYGPGQHGQRRKGKLSDFGVQLRAKQKLKGYYANISERQFHGIYVEAGRMKGDTGENLIGLLERRLDTVIYRAKFVATMFAARQFINHGHVKVNGRRVNIASFKLKVGDVVEVKESSKQLTVVLEANQLSERDVPDFLEVDHSKMTAKFARIPALSDVPFAVQMEPHLIVEFYSRCFLSAAFSASTAPIWRGPFFFDRARPCPGHPRLYVRKQARRGWPGIGE